MFSSSLPVFSPLLDDLQLCSVCLRNYARHDSFYCSDSCHKLAMSFKAQALKAIVRYKIAGFKMRFDWGIMLHVELPDELKPLYPKCAHKFYPSLNQHTLYALHCRIDVHDALRRDLGWATYGMINCLNIRKHETIDVFRNRVYSAIRGELYRHYETFTCTHCQHEYFDTGITRFPSEDICSQCATDQIPF